MSFLKTYIPFYRRNLAVALPVVLSQVGGSIVQLTDLFFVGRLGTIAIAATSFATSLYYLCFIVINGLMMSITPLAGNAYVNGNNGRLINLFQNIFVLCTVSTILIVGFCCFLSQNLDFFGQETAVAELARPYFLTLGFSLIPYGFFFCFKQFFEGLGNTKIAMIITLIGCIVNIIFDYLLIFGKCGFPELGVLGAGIATFISRLIMPILYLIYMRLKPKWWYFFEHFSISRIEWKTLKDLVIIGIPISLQMLLEMAAFTLTGIMAGWISSTAMAAHQITMNISSFAFMVILGISAATTIRVSHQYGIKDYWATRMAVKASIHLMMIWEIITCSTMIIFRNEIAGAFSTDPTVISIASILLIICGLYQFSDGFQCIGIGTLRGIADVKRPMIYAFFTYIVVTLGGAYYLAFHTPLSIYGIWIAFIFGLTLAAILFFLRFNRLMKLLHNS